MAEPTIDLVKRGNDVVLADREGRLVTVAEKDAADVIGQGQYLPASPEQVTARENEKKYGSTLGKIAAGSAAVTAGAFDAAAAIPRAATALGSAALGVQDPLAGIHGRGLQEDLVYLAGEARGSSGEADVRRWREGLHRVSEANPLTTISGRVAGEALGSLGLGVASGRAAALASRGGAALGLGTGARTALGMGAAGATEGALLAQGQVAEEAYLKGDRETTAEKTLAGMGLGALIGGGVGLGLAGASRVFGRSGSRGSTPVDSPMVGRTSQHERQLEDAAERILGEKPSEGFGAKLLEYIESAQSAVSGADRGTLRDYGPFNWSSGARSGRALHRNREAILEGATAEVTSKVDDLLKKSKAVTREVWEVPAKEAQVRKNLGPPPSLVDEVNSIGLGNAKNAGRFDPMPERIAQTRAGYAGATADEVGEIATGRAASRTGKRMPPVDVSVFPDGTVGLNDGRHRLLAAQESGATEILANIRRYDGDANLLEEIVAPVSFAPKPSAQSEMLEAAARAGAALRSDIQSLTQAMGPGANKRYLQDLDSWLTQVDGAVRTGDAGAAYIALDKAKRAIQRKVDTMGATIFSETNPLLREQKQAMVDALEGTQEGVRQFLMDEAVWGAQGAAQREANAAAERYLKVSRQFESGFAAKMGREYGGAGGRPIFDANPAAISSYVRTLGRQEAGLRDKVFREYVEATLELAESINKGYTLEGAGAQALGELREAAKAIKGTLAKADKTVKVANQIDAVIEAEKGGAAGMLGGVFGGGLLGGAPGAALGAALGVVSRPGQMIRQMAAIEQLAANVDTKIGRGLKGFFESFSKPTLPKTLPASTGAARETAKAARELPRRAVMPSALEAFRGKEKTSAAAYEKRVQQLTQLTIGDGITGRAQAALGDLPSVAPRLSADIGGKMLTAVQFLQSKLPSGTLDPTVLQPARKAAPSDLEIAQFARYWTAAVNPLSVFDELRAGTLTHEHVESVRVVYPKLYEHMQIAALDSVRKAAIDGVMIPYQARLQMALLLNLGKEADPTLDPDFMLRVSDYMRAQQQAQPAPRGKPVDVASRLRSGAETLAMNTSEARR